MFVIDYFVRSDFVRKFFEEGEKNFQRPLIFCGPSGAGKGTCIKLLKKVHPNRFDVSVSHTTRSARLKEGTKEIEQDGVEYNFIGKEEFEEMIEKDQFIEFAKVHSNYYGTSIGAIKKIQDEGKFCILDIDVQGTENIFKNYKDPKTKPFIVFVRTPNMEILEERLRGRKTDSEEQIKKRLKNAVGELEWFEKNKEEMIDYVVTTKSFEHSENEMKKVSKKFYGLEGK